MRPPRRGCSRCSRRPCRGDRGRGRLPRAGRRRIVGDAASASRRTGDDQSRWPALQGPHNAQNVAARRCAVREGARDRRRRRSPAASPPIPACRTGWSGSPRRTASCSSTTARRPTRPRRRRRWPPIRRSTGSSAGWPRPDDLDACEPISSAMSAPPTRSARPGRCSPGCSRARCRSASREMLVTAVNEAAGAARAGRGGLAVAGLRLVRPVPGL